MEIVNGKTEGGSSGRRRISVVDNDAGQASVTASMRGLQVPTTMRGYLPWFYVGVNRGQAGYRH